MSYTFVSVKQNSRRVSEVIILVHLQPATTQTSTTGRWQHLCTFNYVGFWMLGANALFLGPAVTFNWLWLILKKHPNPKNKMFVSFNQHRRTLRRSHDLEAFKENDSCLWKISRKNMTKFHWNIFFLMTKHNNNTRFAILTSIFSQWVTRPGSYRRKISKYCFKNLKNTKSSKKSQIHREQTNTDLSPALMWPSRCLG